MTPKVGESWIYWWLHLPYAVVITEYPLIGATPIGRLNICRVKASKTGIAHIAQISHLRVKIDEVL